MARKAHVILGVVGVLALLLALGFHRAGRSRADRPDTPLANPAQLVLQGRDAARMSRESEAPPTQDPARDVNGGTRGAVAPESEAARASRERDAADARQQLVRDNEENGKQLAEYVTEKAQTAGDVTAPVPSRETAARATIRVAFLVPHPTEAETERSRVWANESTLFLTLSIIPDPAAREPIRVTAGKLASGLRVDFRSGAATTARSAHLTGSAWQPSRTWDLSREDAEIEILGDAMQLRVEVDAGSDLLPGSVVELICTLEIPDDGRPLTLRDSLTMNIASVATPEEEARGMQNMADAEVMLRRFESAFRRYAEAERLAPRDVDLRVRIARSHEISGNLPRALEEAKRARALLESGAQSRTRDSVEMMASLDDYIYSIEEQISGSTSENR